MSLPTVWNLVPVTAEYRNTAGGIPQGEVSFVSAQVVVVDGTIAVPAPIIARLNANGEIAVNVPSTNDPDIGVYGGWTYTVHERFPGGRPPYSIIVPHDSAGIDLATVVPAAEVGTVLVPGPAGPPGEVAEAPIDGTPYVRQDAGWIAPPVAGLALGAGTDAELTQTNAAGNAIARAGYTAATILSTAQAAAATIKLDDFATPDDNTDLDATTGRHGLLPKLGGGTTNFFRADGAWAAPPTGGGGEWGTITGTLSAQTDLQTALNLKLDASAYTAVSLAGSFNYLTLTGQTITMFAINLDTHTTGTLPLAKGGTGATTPAGGRIALELGTAALAATGDFATSAQGALAATAVQPGSLATVATTGAYADLSGKPTLGTAAATASTDYATAAQGGLAATAVQPARTITAAGLATGGGDLSANRTITVTAGSAAGTVCEGDDARLSDARTPTAHASSHAPGGTDALPWTTINGRGNTASRPAAAAGNAGYRYHDTEAGVIYRSNGTTWDVEASLGDIDAALAAILVPET